MKKIALILALAGSPALADDIATIPQDDLAQMATACHQACRTKAPGPTPLGKQAAQWSCPTGYDYCAAVIPEYKRRQDETLLRQRHQPAADLAQKYGIVGK